MPSGLCVPFACLHSKCCTVLHLASLWFLQYIEWHCVCDWEGNLKGFSRCWAILSYQLEENVGKEAVKMSLFRAILLLVSLFKQADSECIWNRSLANVEIKLVWEFSQPLRWGQELNNEYSALSLKTSADSQIKFIDVQQVKGWISVRSRQLKGALPKNNAWN